MTRKPTPTRSPTFAEWVEQGKRFWVAVVAIATLGGGGTWAGWQFSELQSDLAAQQAANATQQAELDALQQQLAEASEQLAVLETLAELLRGELTRGES